MTAYELARRIKKGQSWTLLSAWKAFCSPAAKAKAIISADRKRGHRIWE